MPRGGRDQTTDLQAELATEQEACTDLRKKIAELETAGAFSRHRCAQSACDPSSDHPDWLPLLVSYRYRRNGRQAANPTTELYVQLQAERAACADLKKRIANLEAKDSAPKKSQKQPASKPKTQAAVEGKQEALPGACEYVGWETQR